MTENKRFNVFDVDGTIFLEDHKEGSYHIGEIGNVDLNCLNDIADRLNELNDENQAIKKQILEPLWTTEHIRNLEKENEQLKADNNRLVNETAKVVAEHQGRVLDLIDKKIKELKNINNVLIIPRESLEVLEQLKKELQE